MKRSYLIFILLVCLLVGTANADTYVIYGVSGENGVIDHTTGGASYATHRDGSGNGVNTAGTISDVYVRLNAADPLSIYAMGRSAWVFNTSIVPDTYTVTGVIFSPYVYDKNNKMGEPEYGITGFAPASFTGSLIAGDYDSFGNTEYVTRVPWVSLTDYTHYNFTYNSDGLDSINKTGYSYAMVRDSWDLNNSYGGSGGNQFDYTNVRFITSAQGNPDYNVFMEITAEESGGDPPVASFTSNVTSGTANLPVQFNDTSTNTPTGWNWSFRNVTGNNTEIWWSQVQDATQTFGEGNYSIVLNASNTNGYNITPDLYWINVSATSPEPVASFNLTLTDTSTGSPTSWQWNATNLLGNNTPVTFSTDQNPILTLPRGNWLIDLIATNFVGSDTCNSTIGINLTSPQVYFWSRTS